MKMLESQRLGFAAQAPETRMLEPGLQGVEW